MTKRFLLNAVVGTLAERPPPSNPTGGATEAAYGLYVDVDTGDIYETTGSAWVVIGTLAGNGATSISGLVSDGSDGIEVTGDVAIGGGFAATGNVNATDITAGGTVDAQAYTLNGEPLGALVSLVTKTDDYTVLATDHTILVAASGKTVTLPDPSTVPADTEFRIKNTPAGDTTTVEPPQVAPPATPTPSFTQSGGTVVDGIYTVAVSYTNALGETVTSESATVTAAGDPDADTSTLVIQSPDPATGATGWNAYLSQVGGSYLTLQNVSPTDIGTDLTLTAPPTSGGAAPPGGSTASIASIDGAATYTGLTAAKAAAGFVSDGSDYSVF